MITVDDRNKAYHTMHINNWLHYWDAVILLDTTGFIGTYMEDVSHDHDKDRFDRSKIVFW